MKLLQLFFLIVLISCKRKQADLTGIYGDNKALAYIYKENGKEGLLDTNKNILIPAQFDYIEHWLVDGLIRVDSGGERVNGGDFVGYNFKKYGLITIGGKILFRPKFDDLTISDNSALVLLDSLYGYISNNGDWIIKPTFKTAYPFYKGTAVVKADNKFVLLNKDGQRIIKETFDSIYSFKNDVAIVTNNKKWGLINYRGRLILPLGNYRGLGEYNYYHGIFKKDDGKWYLIDTAGNIPVKEGFDSVGTQAEGLIIYAVGLQNGKQVKIRLN
ncbi:MULTISPECIES: WG repeat-containing protein [Niastella]|uniref:WG repeat-containing protein n=1 Tax=Niastella soli TaxID=2821487 RepID=A0ABS3Z0G1_9BACT|nr:WG repeat-containing protein [Niastella soli]MBO9203503.1 WG repeat-containing protein [Niastella soli]